MASNLEKAEFAHDLEVGLARKSVPEFDQLPVVGMAGKLALNIKGLGEIDGAVLRQVADHFFDIPAGVLNSVLEILAEVEYVQLIREGKTIKKVIPNVPHFSSVYDGLGQYLGTITLTEHEEVAIAILEELRSKPDKRDVLMGRLGVDAPVFRRVETVTTEGGLVIPKRAKGQVILVSPFYFADSLDILALKAASGGAKDIARLLDLLKKSQGWPLSLIVKQGEISGHKLTPSEVALLHELVSDGVLRPPSLSVPKTGRTEHFVFTPAPGAGRLNGAEREIYERTMAVVAAVRKGQLLPENYRIRSPNDLLDRLRSAKRIGANSEAVAQYSNLVTLRVGTLVKTTGDRYEFRLIDTPENLKAVDDAILMFKEGAPVIGVNEDARLALQHDEAYIQSLVSATKLRATERPALDAESKLLYDQLILDLR